MNLPSTNPPPPAADRLQLRAQLDALAHAGAGCLRAWRWRGALRDAARWAPLWLGALPLAGFVARASGALDGAPLSFATLAGLTLAGPVLFVLAHVAWSLLQFQPPRTAALALHDQHLKTKDRLVIADEFLGAADLDAAVPHSAFMRAAVEDARNCARAALATPLPPLPVPAWTVRAVSWWGVPLALLFILLGRVPIGVGALSQPPAGQPLPLVADATPVSKPSDNPSPAVRRTPRPPPAAEPATSDEKSSSPTPQMARRARKDQPMEGQPASGGGSQASTSNSSSQSAGLASSQRSKANDKKPELAKSEEQDEKSPNAAQKKPRKKKDPGQLAMDSNSGQGKSSSSSSNLNPFEAPEQPDKSGQDPKADPDDEGDEDEDEQEKSGGVNKPMDNSKAPAVDRNLSTRPPDGDQPGNGRGGPGEIKKTRGVSTMILGIPIPDRVPGTPSPGRSKVTQEFSRPKEEAHPALEAQVHATRSGAVGHVEQPDLLPWRRSLIENYFTAIRKPADDSGEPAAPAPPEARPR